MTTRKTPPAIPGTPSAVAAAREAQAAPAPVAPAAPAGKPPQGGTGGGVGGEAPAVRAIVGTAAARGFLTSKRKRSQTAAVRPSASGPSGGTPNARQQQQQPPPSLLRGASSTGVPVTTQARNNSWAAAPASAAIAGVGLGTFGGATAAPAAGPGPARASGGVAERVVPADGQARAAAGRRPAVAVPSSCQPVNGAPPGAGSVGVGVGGVGVGVGGGVGGGGGGDLNRPDLAAVQQRRVAQQRAMPTPVVPSSAPVAAPATPASSATTYPSGGARAASLALGESSSANAAASAQDSTRGKAAVGSQGGAISTGKGGVEPWDEDDQDRGTAYGGGGGQGRAAVGGGGGGEVVDPWLTSPSGILSAGDREDIAYEVKEKAAGTGEDTVVLLLRKTEVSVLLAASFARIFVHRFPFGTFEFLTRSGVVCRCFPERLKDLGEGSPTYQPLQQYRQPDSRDRLLFSRSQSHTHPMSPYLVLARQRVLCNAAAAAATAAAAAATLDPGIAGASGRRRVLIPPALRVLRASRRRHSHSGQPPVPAPPQVPGAVEQVSQPLVLGFGV